MDSVIMLILLSKLSHSTNVKLLNSNCFTKLVGNFFSFHITASITCPSWTNHLLAEFQSIRCHSWELLNNLQLKMYVKRLRLFWCSKVIFLLLLNDPQLRTREGNICEHVNSLSGVPVKQLSSEQIFLQDFNSCTNDTPGTRMAKWVYIILST